MRRRYEILLAILPDTTPERIAGSRLSIYEGAPHRLLDFTRQFNADALAFLLDASRPGKHGV